MKIVLGSDKSGFELKEFIRAYFDAEGIAYEDVGTVTLDAVKPFYEVAPLAAKAIAGGEAETGVLICGTGMGMAQVATKYPGILAACCESVYAARMSRAINNSNVLCMGGWVIGKEMGLEMVQTFLATGHTEGLEPWRQTFLQNALTHVQRIDQETRA